jgi:hypothetical protein
VTKYYHSNFVLQIGKKSSQNKIVAIGMLILNFWPHVTKGIDLK